MIFESEGLYLWSMYQTEVNKPLVTITTDDSPVRVLVDTGLSVNLLDKKERQSSM